MTSWLREVKEVETQLGSDKLSGTSLRIGASNDIASHPSAGLYHAIMAGGWDAEEINRSFCYLMGLREPMNTAGRVLSGWPNPRKPAPTPRLSAMFATFDKPKIQAFRNFYGQLFQLATFRREDFDPNQGRLAKFVEAVTATVVMYLPMRIADVSASHPVVQQVLRTAAQFRITKQDLIRYADIIRDDWTIQKNLAYVETADPLDIASLDKVHLAVADCSRQYIAMTEKLNEVRSELSALTAALEKVRTLSAVTSSAEPPSLATGMEPCPAIPQAPANEPAATNAFDVMRIATAAPEQFHIQSLTGLTISWFLNKLKTTNCRPCSSETEVVSALRRIFRLAHYCADADEQKVLNALPPSSHTEDWATYASSVAETAKSLEAKIAALLPEESTSRKRPSNGALISTVVKKTRHIKM